MNKLFTFFRATATARFFIPAGIFAVVFGVLLLSFANKSKNWTRTEAVVTRTELAEEEYTEDGEHHEATYYTYVRYEAGGGTYEELLGELSGFKEGDVVKVIYDPDHPENVSQPVGMILPFVFIGAGIAAAVFGAVSLIRELKKEKALRDQEKEWNYGK